LFWDCKDKRREEFAKKFFRDFFLPDIRLAITPPPALILEYAPSPFAPAAIDLVKNIARTGASLSNLVTVKTHQKYRFEV